MLTVSDMETDDFVQINKNVSLNRNATTNTEIKEKNNQKKEKDKYDDIVDKNRKINGKGAYKKRWDFENDYIIMRKNRNDEGDESGSDEDHEPFIKEDEGDRKYNGSNNQAQ